MFSFFKSFMAKKRQQRAMEKKGLIGSRKRRKQDNMLGSIAERSKLLGILILAIVWCACIVVLVISEGKDTTMSLIEGQRAPKSIFTDFTFSYEDKEMTKIQRQKNQG